MTPIYCLFDAESLDEVLESRNNCISDIRSWMITSKLNINDSKTEFLLITSPRSNSLKTFKYLLANLKSVHLPHLRVLGLCLMISVPWIPINITYNQEADI